MAYVLDGCVSYLLGLKAKGRGGKQRRGKDRFLEQGTGATLAADDALYLKRAATVGYDANALVPTPLSFFDALPEERAWPPETASDPECARGVV